MNKNISFISILLVILGSCTTEDQLSGIWIAAYQVHHSSDEPSLSSVRSLMQFEGDRITVKSLDLLDSQDEVSGTYHIKNGNLVYKIGESGFDTLKIVTLAEDSLVFEINNSYRREVVFRKFEENVSPTSVDMLGKAYTINSNYFADSIEIIDDANLIHLSDFSYQVEPWTLKHFNGYKFLIIGQFSQPFFVSSISNDTVSLIGFGKKRMTVTMIKLSRISDPHVMIGSWIETKRYGREPYPTWISKIEMVIDKDSLRMFEGNKIETKLWKIDATGTWVYFPEEMSSTSISIWRLIEAARDKVTIERRTLHFQENSERIEFHRQ